MDLITDGLIIAAAAFAGTYCHVLARRVRALRDLESGIGGAITRMTRALEDARRALGDAKSANRECHNELRALIGRAEAASGQLRILLAATRDLPEPPAPAWSRPLAVPAPEWDDEPAEARPGGASCSSPAPRAERRPPPRLPLRASMPLTAPAASAQAALEDELERALHKTPGPSRSMAAVPTPRARHLPASEEEILAALSDIANPGRS